ncbi:hypothetical protein ACTJKK_03120 [Microbacterium sp. 22179]|uniref:hypothetical protein n=1 Tax=Microbacterium sp. 22179 TaxID=3453886 RepID=UPI003F854B94
MKPWEPWDASDAEIADLYVIREQIPESLEEPIFGWLRSVFLQATQYGEVNPPLVHFIETSLRTRLNQAHPSQDELAAAITSRGEKFTLRVVDLLLSTFEPEPPYGSMPESVAMLNLQMERSGSAVAIVGEDRHYRLARRMPEGVEEAAQMAVQSANVTAGRHLVNAWQEMQGLEPDASKILREGIQAVEAAAGGQVIPKDKKPQLSKIVGALRQQQGWGLAFARRDDGHPDHLAVLIGMLETLAFAEQHRHSGHGYSLAQATGHVQLAATLVGWFSADVVVRHKP